MPGMLGAFGPRNMYETLPGPPSLLHRPDVTAFSEWAGETGFVQHARFEFDDLRDTVHEEGGYRFWFCGDLPARERVPWDLFVRAIRDGDWSSLTQLHTPFAVAVFRESDGRAWLISDRRSQSPIFYRNRGGTLDFSTLMSAFDTRLGGAEFSPEWLYEVLYFNYPVLETSFFKDVRRLPPASVLSWEAGTGDIRLERYAPPFARTERFVSGREGLELARTVFSEAAGDCYRTRHPVAVPLTAGFDSRTALAYAPPSDQADLLLFTYGQPGCYDLVEAVRTAKTLGLDHRVIPFDAAFREMLPRLAEETVRLSDGQERILRATQPHVFSTLSSMGRRVLVSGVSGDHIFRDHIRGRGNVPALMSRHLMDYIETGNDHLDDHFFRELLGSKHPAFLAHIRKALGGLEDRHGLLSEPEGYVRFLVYETAPKYFGGEAAIAGQFLIYRTPYWDSRVVDLAFHLDRGTVGLSTRLPGKDRYIEAGLQAYLVGKSPHYGGAPIKGVSPAAYARGIRSLYKLERVLRLGPKKLKMMVRNPRVPSLENWKGWLDGELAPSVDSLLGPESGLGAYLESVSLEKIKASGDLIRIGQLASAELVLRRIDQGWEPVE